MANELAAAGNGWREPVLAALDGAQRGWLATLNALGWTEPVDGQPAWPHAWRFSAQVLGYDDGLLRQLVLAATASLLAVLALICAALALFRWRSQQGQLKQHGGSAARDLALGAVIWPLILAAALLWLMPWPAAHLWLTPAVPTSFHRAPAPFSAQHIVAGQALYAQHCASCHGATGRGDGPQAEREVAQGGVWPPMLVGGLLGKRLEGELLWRARHGWSEVDSTSGQHRVAHDFSAQLSTTQTWQLLDFVSASAAGQNLREAGNWPQPVRLPQLTASAPLASTQAQARAAHPQSLPAFAARPPGSNWLATAHANPASCASPAASSPTPAHGDNARCAQLLAQSPLTRLVFAQVDGRLPQTPALQPDARLLTVLVLPPSSAVAQAQATAANTTSSRPANPVIDCQIQDADFSAAMALLLGVPAAALPGHQVLSDRDGWLRARSAPGAPGWQEGDLICKPASKAADAPAAPQGTGLDALIARMDATPLALTRAGFVAH